MKSSSRYIVGIDLGTTNCAVSYIDTTEILDEFEEPEVHVFPIPQISEPGQLMESEFLPAYTYIPSDVEFPKNSLDLPWQEDMSIVIGNFAVKRGAEVAARLIASSKSWLCHPHVDRTSPILPWNAPESVDKRSPLDVSSFYLSHIRQAWNHSMAENEDDRLEQQNVFLTVPASFDAVARELTVKAAGKAGLTNITLLEEPQAAFYSWINNRKKQWRKETKAGDIVLVCDIGGGTTDFSLIEVTEEEGDLVLQRIAVGDHILLGGDNMDLTLAYEAKKHFTEKGIKLDSQQMLALVYNCRLAKEKMLNDPECVSQPVVILGRGRSVVGGTIQTEIKRDEVEKTVLEGFFPPCSIDDSPTRRRAAGLKEIGLHYESDSAITKHLARFLRKQGEKLEEKQKKFLHPTKILFNGGVSKSSVIKERVIEVLNQWLADDNEQSVAVIEGNNPDLAVACGAAYYGLAKLRRGVRIRGGTSRTYYVGIETAMPAVPGMAPPIKALCVVPFGMEEGSDTEIKDHEFGLVVGEQAVFRFLGSTTRKKDETGMLLEEWEEEELVELAPLETALTHEDIEGGTVVPVTLHSYVTEVGTLELWCESVDGKYRWKLEFNVRETENEL